MRTPEQVMASCRQFALQMATAGVGVSQTLDEAADLIKGGIAKRMNAPTVLNATTGKTEAEVADMIAAEGVRDRPHGF